MKRIIALCLLAVMLLGLTGCNQEPQRMSLKGINVTLTVPGDLNVFTQELQEDDPVLEKFNTNKAGVERGLRNRKSYLYVFDDDQSFGLDFCCMVSKTDDYKDLSQEDQHQLVWDYKASLVGAYEIHEAEIRRMGTEDYVFLHYSDSVNHYWRWSTNRSDRLYYGTLTSAEEAVGREQLPWVEEMLTSMAFN